MTPWLTIVAQVSKSIYHAPKYKVQFPLLIIAHIELIQQPKCSTYHYFGVYNESLTFKFSHISHIISSYERIIFLHLSCNQLVWGNCLYTKFELEKDFVFSNKWEGQWDRSDTSVIVNKWKRERTHWTREKQSMWGEGGESPPHSHNDSSSYQKSIISSRNQNYF